MLSTFAFPEPPSSKTSKKKAAREESHSVSNLSDLVKRLSHQVEKLENWSEKGPSRKEANLDQRSPTTGNILIDPLSPDVPNAYEALLQELAHNKTTDKLSCSCCAAGHPSNINIEISAGIPWLPPPPTQSTWSTVDDPLRNAYAYWCTLMRCLPMLDSTSQRYIRTIGLYAMRQLLESIQQQGNSVSNRGGHLMCTVPEYQRFSSSAVATGNHTNNTTTTPLLKNSMSCLSFQQHHYHHHHNYQQQQQQQQGNIMDEIIDPNRRKADAWVLPSQTTIDQQPISPSLTMPQSRTFSSPTPTPSSIPGDSSSSSGHRSSAAKLKQWFKKHHKITPGSGNGNGSVTRGSSQPFLHSSTAYNQTF